MFITSFQLAMKIESYLLYLSMISKVKESKDLQKKMKTAQKRMQSTSSEFEEFDDAIDCKIELELEELESKKEECDNDIADLHRRLEDERNQYLDILRYIFILSL